MSKVLTSPIERWAGSVTIADPLTIPQAQLIEAAMRKPETEEGEKVWLTLIDSQRLPAILGCVTLWGLDNIPVNVTAETFPASPRVDSHKLIDWIFSEILKVYLGEAIVPNA